MPQVHELSNGDLFVLPHCGGNTVYEFDRNVFDEKGVLLESKVRVIAAYWPEGGRGAGQPAQWVLCNDRYITNCNLYSVAKLVRFMVEDLEV